MTGLARLIQARARIKFYAPSIAWVVLLLLVTSLIAVFVNREWFHRVLAPLNIALMLAYIAVLFARLR